MQIVKVLSVMVIIFLLTILFVVGVNVVTQLSILTQVVILAVAILLGIVWFQRVDPRYTSWSTRLGDESAGPEHDAYLQQIDEDRAHAPQRLRQRRHDAD